MDFLTQKYTAQSVALATGATAKQITDWCNQGLVTGQREPLGKGYKRHFSWYNAMEIAAALALMDIGIKAPGDAFRAAVQFSHIGEGGVAPLDDDAIADDDHERGPGLPYHHNHGETFLLLSGEYAHVIHTIDGKIDLGSLNHDAQSGWGAQGFIAVNMTRVFMEVAQRMGWDGRQILDAAYPEEAQ